MARTNWIEGDEDEDEDEEEDEDEDEEGMGLIAGVDTDGLIAGVDNDGFTTEDVGLIAGVDGIWVFGLDKTVCNCLNLSVKR